LDIVEADVTESLYDETNFFPVIAMLFG